LDRLQALVKDRNAPQKHVWRAQIVLLTAEGLGTSAIMRETSKAKTCVWRWQVRFAAEGFERLLRDKRRPSRIPKLDPSIAERVVTLTMEAPPGETTHWTGAAMAEAAGVSVSSVQRIWRAHGLQPRRIRQFKLSKDPEFIDKLHDVVGTLHFTPTSASLLNAVEGFFATLAKRRLKRGVFRSVSDLQVAINRFPEEHNQQSQPFTWTADPDKIIAAVRRGRQALDSLHSHVRRFKLQA
jgi:transposase